MNLDLEMLKQRLRIPELWVSLGFPGTPAKSCRCPWREDKNNSFSVFEEGTRWKDFATDESGDAIDFLARARGLSLKDAILEFRKAAGENKSPVPGPDASSPAQSCTPFNWRLLTDAAQKATGPVFPPDHRYSPEFEAYLISKGFCGLKGLDIAFPVQDENNNIIGCHYRLPDKSWRYLPGGTKVNPLVFGDLANAKAVFAFESQWDAFAVMSLLNWHITPPPETAVFVTRGASNGRLIAGQCATNATVYAFVQNDPQGDNDQLPPAEKWLQALASACECECRRVSTPLSHKDPDEWLKAGAQPDDVRKAISEAGSLRLERIPALNQQNPRSITQSEPSEEPEIASFPVDALPPTMALMVNAVAECERVPAALAAVSAIAVVSASIGSALQIISGPNRTTHGNLFFLASAESGSGKSETFRLVAGPLVDYQTRRIESWREKILPQVQSQIRVLDREIASLEKKAAKTMDLADRERMVGELEFKLATKDRLSRQLTTPCIIAQDVTTERLAGLLHDNRETIFSASADARKLVENLLGRYNPGKTTDESLYLSAFSGDFVRVDRQGREPIILNRPCLSLCWFIQPDMLVVLLDEKSLSASGFLPRVLICHTRATPRKIDDHPKVLPEALKDKWTNLVSDLLTAYHEATQSHRIEPTPEVLALLNDFYNKVVDRRSADLADVGAFAARYAENAWRMVLVFHAALHGAQADEHPVCLETGENALRVMEWFIGQQLDVLAKGRRAAAESLETEVFELFEKTLERKQQNHVTARDVYRARIVSDPCAALALLSRMEADELLTSEDSTPTNGGKTTRLFRMRKVTHADKQKQKT